MLAAAQAPFDNITKCQKVSDVDTYLSEEGVVRPCVSMKHITLKLLREDHGVRIMLKPWQSLVITYCTVETYTRSLKVKDPFLEKESTRSHLFP